MVNGSLARVARHHLPDAVLIATISVLLGTCDGVLLIGWHAINPTNLDWLKSDPTVFQAGWEFLRREPWGFPPTWIGHLDYPFGVSAAYLDVIPLIAVPMRMLSGILPAQFQYFGMYIVVCLVLQAYFGWRLMSCFTPDRFVTFLGTLFFLNAPILLSRLYVHFSLSSQWLVLAGLYYYFRQVDRSRFDRYLAPLAALIAIAGGITPYLSVMILFIALAAMSRSVLEYSCRAPNRTESGRQAHDQVSCDFSAHGRKLGMDQMLSSSRLLWLSIFMACATSSLILFGFMVLGSSLRLEGDGYTMFSLNLLSPFSASGFRAGDPGYEGYNYLGAGVVLLLAVCLARRPSLLARLWDPAIRPLLIVSILLTMIALSVRVAFGRTVVFVAPAPPLLLQLLAIFRGSGRFFWPVDYLIVLGAVVGTASVVRTPKFQRAILAAAFTVQFIDTLPLRQAVAEQIATTRSNPLVSPDWGEIHNFHKHLVVLPAWQCDLIQTPGGDAEWPWFADLAARTGLTLNSVHAARTSTASQVFNCRLLPLQVMRGDLKSDTAYVLSDRLAHLAREHSATHTCRLVDDVNLCTFDSVKAAFSPQ